MRLRRCTRIRSHCIVLMLAVVAVVFAAGAQQEQKSARMPRVSFQLAKGRVAPENFNIQVDAAGNATYRAIDVESDSSDPYLASFTMSQPTREKIFALAESLHHFAGKYDYTKVRVADTGIKTLAFEDEQGRVTSSYNWSENKDVQELTAIFQGISESFEFARKIEHHRRFDRLSLGQDLKSMEYEFHEGRLYEIAAIRPVLEKLANDTAVLKTARESAKRILAGTAGK